jgi:ABC-type Fe3+-hydroxamate transport system substrate-binding protein
MNRTILLDKMPSRIVSLVPSQSELLFDLGLEAEVIGITKFCIYPNAWFRSKTRVGGTKKLDLEKIEGLRPDLIIGNKEENEQSQIRKLMSHFPVWMSDISNLKEALQMIRQLGLITGTASKADQITEQIRQEFNALPKTSPSRSTLYFIWKKPYMVAGNGTFINEMLLSCGLRNAMLQDRYPSVNEDTIRQIDPELILLSSEPYPFKEQDIAEFHSLCPRAEIRIVDGEYFSWYGTRMQGAPRYFRSLFFPEIV